MSPLIIMGFPGVGKTYCKERFKCSEFKVLDSDSSLFPKGDFPNNYFNYLVSVYKHYDLILTSTHKSVREGIKKTELMNNCKIFTCYPSMEIKAEWIDRLYRRGNNDDFCSLISSNYDSWISDIEKDQFNRLIIDSAQGNLLDSLVQNNLIPNK